VTEHRYPSRALIGAYGRAGVGLVLTVVPLAAVPVDLAALVALGTLATVFAAYGGHTLLRHATRIVVDDERIRAVGPIGAVVAWSDLTGLRLKYYSTRRDGRNGWHQLDLEGPGRTLTIESSLGGFGEIVARAVRAADRRGLELSPTTRSNLAPWGLAPARHAPSRAA
jgi:hypothetical protein